MTEVLGFVEVDFFLQIILWIDWGFPRIQTEVNFLLFIHWISIVLFTQVNLNEILYLY